MLADIDRKWHYCGHNRGARELVAARFPANYNDNRYIKAASLRLRIVTEIRRLKSGYGIQSPSEKDDA
jgi:hypothetical protein